jgi:hypothetical protein
MTIDTTMFGAEPNARLSSVEDLAAAADEAIRQMNIANGKRAVTLMSKGWVCKSRVCCDELDSERLFCNGACATAFSNGN